MKILIVEDDFVARRVLQRLLASYGQAEVAVSGEEAVAAFLASVDDKEPYDLICLDIMLPGIDGQEVLRRIRSHSSDSGQSQTKIIMTSSLRDSRNVLRAFKSQADAYLTKPFTSVALTEALKEAGFASKDVAAYSDAQLH